MRPSTIRDLRLHLRAWERHRIRFGVLCPYSRLPLCGDLFPAACAIGWNRRNGTVTAGAGSAVLLSDDSLVYRFPHRHENPRLRGALNRRFLDPAPVRRLLQGLPAPVSTVILPLPPVYRTESLSFEMFLRRLERFLAGMPCGFQLGIEMQEGRFLLPDYFDLLARYRVAHVFGDAPSVPTLLEQVQIPMALTAGRCIVRSEPGTDPVWQLGVMETVRRCVDENRELYLFLNDAGGGTEAALSALMVLLEQDLAKLSPLRRKKAA